MVFKLGFMIRLVTLFGGLKFNKLETGIMLWGIDAVLLIEFDKWIWFWYLFGDIRINEGERIDGGDGDGGDIGDISDGEMLTHIGSEFDRCLIFLFFLDFDVIAHLTALYMRFSKVSPSGNNLTSFSNWLFYIFI